VLWDFVQTLYREFPREAVATAVRAVLRPAA
jgi:hypothetical protein